jgi:phenylacetic acid degradation operon negative regulatory protein
MVVTAAESRAALRGLPPLAPVGGHGGVRWPVPGGLPVSEQLQPQELIVTMLGVYVRPFGDRVWSGGLVVLLGELGFSEGAARVAFTRLVRRGLITRVRDGRLVHYRLTRRADRLLAEGDRRIFSLGQVREAEGDWTVLWHQIPEDRRLERSRLARRLRFLGFGSVQDSLWVSPHDHSDEVGGLLGELSVDSYATLFTAHPDAVVGLPALVARAWDLSGLVDRYEAFSDEFSSLCRPRAFASLDDRESFAVRTRLVHQFRGFPLVDPELPERLAPVSAARERAAEIFHELYEGLAPGSQRHFEAVTAAYVSAE